eukprot:6213471-Pleurochrysis_carterae.AAC.2
MEISIYVDLYRKSGPRALLNIGPSCQQNLTKPRMLIRYMQFLCGKYRLLKRKRTFLPKQLARKILQSHFTRLKPPSNQPYNMMLMTCSKQLLETPGAGARKRNFEFRNITTAKLYTFEPWDYDLQTFKLNGSDRPLQETL